MARTSKRARKTSPLNLPGAFELFSPSKEIVLKNIWIFGPLYAVPFVFWIHSWIWSPLPNQHIGWWTHGDKLSAAWPGSPLPTYGTFLVVGFSLLWLLIIGVIGTVVQIMTQAAQLDAVEDRPLTFGVLWATVKDLGWRMLGLYIITALVIVIGFLLLIIPGLIMLRRYYLASFVMLDKKTGIRESMDISAELTKQNPGAIWGILGVVFLIGLINIVPVIGGLAAFAVGSLYSLAPAMRYQQLQKFKNLA